MATDNSILPDSEVLRQKVSLMALLGAFVRLGMATFGGGVQAWVHRDIVVKRRWLDEKEFLSGLTVAQVLPGANPVNIALYVGMRLRGGVGGAIAVLGMVIPAFCVILVLGYLYRTYGHFEIVHFVLAGMAAAAVGATLQMGIKLAGRLPRNVMAPVVGGVCFALVGILRWPMVPVVAIAAPISIAWAFILERKASNVR